MSWPQSGWPPNTEDVSVFGQDFTFELPLLWTPERDETGRWPRPPCPRRQLPTGWQPEMAEVYPFPGEIPAVLSGWHLRGAEWVRVDALGWVRASGFKDRKRALKTLSYRQLVEQTDGKPSRFVAHHTVAVPDDALTWDIRQAPCFADDPLCALQAVDQELLHQGWRLLGALDLSYLPKKLMPYCS